MKKFGLSLNKLFNLNEPVMKFEQIIGGAAAKEKKEAKSEISSEEVHAYFTELNERLTAENNIEKRNKILLESMRAFLADTPFTHVTSYEPGKAKDFLEDLRFEFSDPRSYKEWDEEILWRGDNPEILLNAVGGNTSIELSSDFFNVATEHQVSISYSGGYRDDVEEAMFNMCIGFTPEHGAIMGGGGKEVDLEGVYDVQKEMLRFGGKIAPEDIRHIFVRSHGTGPGKVGRTYLFTSQPLNEELKEVA